jgi:drug/metabolite transporter (DMT)-like permease
MKLVRKPTGREMKYIFIGALFNVVCHHFFLSLGLSKTSASNGGIILGLGPILTTILSIIFLKHRVTLLRTLGIFLGFAGVAFTVILGSGGISGVSIGDVFVFLAILAQCLSFIVIKKATKTLDPRLMTAYMIFIGSIILFIISQVMEPNGIKSMEGKAPGVWAIFFASALIATAVGHLIYNYGVGKIGPSEASIFINLNPFFSLIGSILFLGEKISIYQIGGFIMILFGVILGSGVVDEFLEKRKENVANSLDTL